MKNTPKWPVLLQMIKDAGPAGVERDATIKALGTTVDGLKKMLRKARYDLPISARWKNGDDSRTMIFVATEYANATKSSMKASRAPAAVVAKNAIHALVDAAGADGVSTADAKAACTCLASYKSARAIMGREAKTFLSIKNPLKARIFAKAEWRDAYEVMLSQAKNSVVPRKAEPSKPDPVMAFRNREAVIPAHVRVQVAPTPLPRFHVAQIGRHVNPAECRPWAAAAGASW